MHSELLLPAPRDGKVRSGVGTPAPWGSQHGHIQSPSQAHDRRGTGPGVLAEAWLSWDLWEVAAAGGHPAQPCALDAPSLGCVWEPQQAHPEGQPVALGPGPAISLQLDTGSCRHQAPPAPPASPTTLRWGSEDGALAQLTPSHSLLADLRPPHHSPRAGRLPRPLVPAAGLAAHLPLRQVPWGWSDHTHRRG